MSLADCPSNLKEAIDWILRVTGKDGGGSDNTRALAEAVKGLLGTAAKEVESLTSIDYRNGAELSKLKEGLSKAVRWVEKDVKGGLFNNSPGPIGRLSDGLAAFIGYGSKGTFADPPTAGKLTGAGIAPSNMATHRLCDATIAFTIGVLEGCKKKVGGGNVTKLDTVITTLHAKYGTGTQGLKAVAAEVKSQLKDLPGGVRAFLNDIGTAFQTLGSAIQSPTQPADVATKVGEYLKGVFTSHWGSANGVDVKLKAIVSALKSDDAYDPGKANSAIKAVGGALNPKPVVNDALTAGKKAFISQLKKNYTPTNYETLQQPTPTFTSAHAKIFLGCLPFIFNNLSYFYWQCREGGPWRNQNLTGGALSAFMQGHWFFNSNMNENMTGTSVVRNVLDKKFEELKTAATQTSSAPSYAGFLKKFRETGQQNWHSTKQTVTPSNYLSGLYTLCSCYFQCQQIKNAKEAFRTPQTIREMLYFLAALQFSPQYDAFDGYVTEYFKAVTGNQSGNDSDLKLQVADSGTSAKGNTLSAADVKSYLLSTCIFIPGALGVMQGPGASKKSEEPWLFELFCNSAFNFKYPTGASLFSLISNYAYALQFQVLFLYLMCSTYVDKCGWNNCTYGKEVKPNGSGETLASHICPGLKCQQDRCDHKKGTGDTKCNHNNYNATNGCGKGSNPSPLQAFLTDGIQGMCRQHPGSSYHLATCSGSLCHVPMGFKAEHLRQKAVTGNHILTVLNRFCGGSDTPLRQLCEKLGCLSKRTPRLLGDLFGFTWHLKGQLAKTLGNITTANWFKDLGGHTPFSYAVEKKTEVLVSFVGSSQTHSNSHETSDLKSLSNTGCNKPDKTCGPYLYPFTLSNGATFGKSAPYASTYLSWMVYLTDDLQTGFQEFLDEFKNIDCSKTGCLRKSTSGTQACTSHAHGDHGISTNCTCDSVVHCGGVLPLLYRFGFTFGSVNQLSGTNKRTCDKLATQLQKVLSPQAPLDTLITTIDDFLYLFRFYFFYNQSAYWTIYVCLILYTFFFLLDTLRVRSHLKLTSSHTVPPLALLTTGKARALTKLTYYLP